MFAEMPERWVLKGKEDGSKSHFTSSVKKLWMKIKVLKSRG